MIGKPKFKYNDIVQFTIQGKQYTGKVYIIDAYGTFEDESDVSYDVLIDKCDEFEDGCLFKHLREDLLTKC